MLEPPHGLTELTAALGRDEQVRAVDRVPTKLVIADRSLAMVPLTSRTAEPAALVVHASGLLQLLAGLTDASVAKQLDLGLRTVQRRVRRLMELAGVTTRLQLGRHAYERGWVTRA